MHLEQDLTDLANFSPGPHAINFRIATPSDPSGQVSGSNAGWTLTARLEVTPGAAPRRVLAVTPLFNLALGPDAGTSANFDIPTGATSARLEYRATGHGGGASSAGCIGPAEEFCQRLHRVTLDGVEVFTATPWRTDCADRCTIAHHGSPGFDYCQENPTGVIQSVKAPRANWCPGAVTPPLLIDTASLASVGSHALSLGIDGVQPGGSWQVSAVLYVYE
jgi:hypothetical protein